MQLPFGPDQFFGVFQYYNQTLWSAVLVLWLASLAAVVSLISHRRAPNRMIPIAWSAIGGSAAWLLNVHADVVLPIAGVVLVVDLIMRVEFASGCIARGSPHASSEAHMVRR